MPEAFEKCRAGGGKIRTKTLDGGRYQHVCIDEAGKSHPGYVKTKKGSEGDSHGSSHNPGKARLGTSY